MGDIVWKKFVLGETFSRNVPPSTNVTAKQLDISDEPFDGSIALITRAETNNGVRGYIEKGTFPTLKNAITYNDQFSFFLYHDYEFTTIKDHLSVIRAKQSKLQKILDEKPFVNGFIVMILNHVFSKEIFSFNFTGADYRYDREIIMLPCSEVSGEEDYIWKEQDKYFTLAVDYIKKIMNEAKEVREQKTIRFYEVEKAKLEAERVKYEARYQKERRALAWKKFTLGSLFDFDGSNQLPFTKKQLDVMENKNETFNIAVVSQSERNNGITGYLDGTTIDPNKIMRNVMIYSLNFGTCFYQHDDFVLLDTHGSIFRLIAKSSALAVILSANKIVGNFFAKMIMKICKNGVYNYNWKPNSQRAGLEYIMLPCIEVTAMDGYIWEENGKYYTLAIDYISYLYLTGRINHNQRLIDNYSYQY